MRRRGERGHLPGKSVPQRNRPVRLEFNEDIDAGVYRGPTSVDKIMAEKFKGEDHIEKFPHGYDPFTEGQTSLKKKVVFRPNKHQLDAIRNRKKTISVNAESKVNGEGPVQHEKQFSSKNVNYVELKTYALSGVVTKGEHEQPILDKKSKVVEMQSGIDSGHLEDVESGHLKTSKSRKNTQAVDNVTTNPEYMEYEPLFISKTELAKAQYRKNNSIREDFNTKATIDQTMIEREVTAKSSKVKARGHDVVAEDTQANFDGFEVDGDQPVIAQKSRKQRDQSDYAIDNYQDFEELVNPVEMKAVAPSRRQKATVTIETQEEFGTIEGNRQFAMQNKPSRQKHVTFETTDDYDSQPGKQKVSVIKKGNRQSQVELDSQVDIKNQSPGDRNSQSKNRTSRQRVAELDAGDDVESGRVEIAMGKSAKASRHQTNPESSLAQEDYQVQLETGGSKVVKVKSRRQKGEIEETANYELETGVEDNRNSQLKNKASRQQGARNLEQDALAEYNSKLESYREAPIKSRRQKVELESDTVVDYDDFGGETAESRPTRSRKSQAQIGLETQDEGMSTAVQRPSIGRMKNSRQKPENQRELDTHLDYNAPTIEEKDTSRQKVRRQKGQSTLSEEADPEYEAPISHQSNQGKSKSRRHQAEVGNSQTYDEGQIVVEKSSSGTKSTKNRHQVSVDEHDAEIEYPAIESQLGKHLNKTAGKKISRQAIVGDEEAKAEYEEYHSTHPNESIGKKINRQREFGDEDARIEYETYQSEHSNSTTLKSRRHQAAVADQRTYDESPIAAVERSSNPKSVKNRRQVSVEQQEAEIEYPNAQSKMEIDQRKTLSRQKSPETQEAAIDNFQVSDNREKNQTGQRRHVVAEELESGKSRLDQLVNSRDETSVRIKNQRQKEVAPLEASPEHIDPRSQPEKTSKPKRRVQFAIDEQPEKLKIEISPSSKPEINLTNQRRTQAVPSQNQTATLDQTIESRDGTSQDQHRQKQAVGIEESSAILEIGAPPERVMPNIRPVKQQAEPGVMIAIRAPELDVKTRIEQALERSRRQMAVVESQEAAAIGNPTEMPIKVEEVKTSNRRQYSAKQDEEVSGVMVSGHRTNANDVNQNSNRRQESAGMNGYNQNTTAQSDLEVGTRLVAEKQKVDGRVDEADVTQHSGMLNPVDEDAGIDPVSLEAANAKKHLAREASLETTPDTIIYEEGADKTGLETNTRARTLIIDPSIFARGYAPIRLRRRK